MLNFQVQKQYYQEGKAVISVKEALKAFYPGK